MGEECIDESRPHCVGGYESSGAATAVPMPVLP